MWAQPVSRLSCFGVHQLSRTHDLLMEKSGWRDQGQQHNSSVFCAMMVIEQTHSTGMGWPRKGTEKRLRNMKAYYFTQARILELFAISFSRRSSWQRDWTWVSHIAGRFFTIWVAMKAPCYTTASRKRTHSWPRRAPWGSWGGAEKAGRRGKPWLGQDKQCRIG